MGKKKGGSKGRGPSFAEIMEGKNAAVSDKQIRQRAFIEKFDKMHQGIDGQRMPVAYTSIVGFVDEAVTADVLSGRADVASFVQRALKASGIFKQLQIIEMRLWNEDHERYDNEESLMLDAVIRAVETVRAQLDAQSSNPQSGQDNAPEVRKPKRQRRKDRRERVPKVA